MKQQTLVTEQFGNTANAYLTSAVHAQGADLKMLQQIAQRYTAPRILDLGCGAGHVSFAVAPSANQVIAYDLSEQMLAVVAQAAGERQLGNIQTQAGPAEQLPFPDGAFDLVMTRFSAHHWFDVPRALKEIHRVLGADGTAVFVDIVAPEAPLSDTTLQAIELLRDASHVRDYRISEWGAMLAATGFTHACRGDWKLVMVFDEWIARMRTPPERVRAIRSLLDSAPEEAARYLDVQPDHTFSIRAALFEARKQPVPAA
jgi:ubiquinone/menaquinone biosynthesis C-methylase UbiE